MISTEKRAQIKAYHDIGMAQKTIAERLGVSQSCVSKTIRRIKETGIFSSRPRGHRPRITSKRTDHIIRRHVLKIPTISSREIKSSLTGALDKVPSTRTIRRRRRRHDEFRLKSYKPAQRPRLSKKNIADRMRFATATRHWDAAKWRKVMFSDESTILQFKNYSTSIRRPANKRYDQRYVVLTVKRPTSVMVWGSITAKGRAGLEIIPVNTTVNAAKYLTIVQEKLPVWMPLHETTIFQQDGAPCHTARSV